ncbi:Hsp20/alpha crystallin family protein [Patescibacteria group bacterium]|nr:Hsp20/alpha crystallin family protein [Patescibacteria group bacterium]
MKLSWTKISNLDKDTLEKQGEDLIVIYAEEKKKDKVTDKRFLIRKKDKQLPPKDWFPDHGQGKIEVDIYEIEKNNQLIIESTIAGIKAKDIDITVEPDLVIIRGQRKKQRKSGTDHYYYQECFWGKFSRTLVLPCRVFPDQVTASLKNGILTIILTKAEDTSKSIEIEE